MSKLKAYSINYAGHSGSGESHLLFSKRDEKHFDKGRNRNLKKQNNHFLDDFLSKSKNNIAIL